MEFYKYSFKNFRSFVKRMALKNKEIALVEIGKDYFKLLIFDNSQAPGISLHYTKYYEQETNILSAKGMEGVFKNIKEKLGKEDFSLEKITFIVAISGIAYIEALEFPELPKRELQEAIAWEMPQHVPWSEGEYEYRYKLKNAKATKHEDGLEVTQEIMIYVIPKQFVDNIVNIFENENLNLGCITLEESIEYVDENKVKMDVVDFFDSFYSKQKPELLRDEYAQLIMTAISWCQGEYVINFLKKERQYTALYHSIEQLFKYSCLACLGMSILLLGLLKGLDLYDLHQKNNLQEKLTQYNVWEKRFVEVQKIEKELKYLEEKIAYIEKNKIKWSILLKQVASCLPENCWLTKVEQENNKEQLLEWIVLQGKAENMAQVTQFTDKLKAKGFYEKVELINSSAALNNKGLEAPATDFKVRIKLSGKRK